MSAAAARVRHWREHPVDFVREQFQAEPDRWQVEALNAFADSRVPRLSLQACAGPGKSAVLAWCIWHFLATQGERGDHPKGFATSVTHDNLRANLWPELSKWQHRSEFLMAAFTWTKERVFANDHEATWFVEARTWPKTASAEEQGKTLSGLHGGYVAAFVDESGAIPPAVMRAADQALSTGPKFGKLLQAGNPISRHGMLHAASSTLAHQWRVVRITGDPDDPNRSPRIDIGWAREQIATYGRENPWVKAYILGEFPPSGLNELLGVDEVRAAMERPCLETDIRGLAKVLGVDVAREGDDASVVFPRQGICAFEPRIARNISSVQGAGLVASIWNDWQADAAFVDNTGGFGGGWLDQLRHLGHSPIGIHFAGEPRDRRYLNKRAEMWFAMAEWVRGGGCLPNVPALVAELTTPTYFFSGDRVQIEDKKQVKVRLGRSPDLADALALTFAAPVHPRRDGLVAVAGKKRRKRNEFDPFEWG